MENASKALIMAGGMLFSLLVIALLVIMYQNLTQVQGTDYNVELTKQIAEYNKQYEVFLRDDLYGSDILSLANKVIDYNAREVDGNLGDTKLYDGKGYQKMEIVVTFKERLDNTYFRQKEYSAEELTTQYQELDKKIKSYSNKSNYYKGKSIPYYAGLRDNELTQIMNDVGGSKEEVKQKIQEYNELKNLQTDIRRKTFRSLDKTEYDDKTGRITKMYFEEK